VRRVERSWEEKSQEETEKGGDEIPLRDGVHLSGKQRREGMKI